MAESGQRWAAAEGADPDEEQRQQELWRALSAPGAPSARERFCRAAGTAFSELGHLTAEGAAALGEEHLEAVGLLLQLGGELAESCLELLAQERQYAASALLRQLVEVEYLAGEFVADRPLAVGWLGAPPDEVREQLDRGLSPAPEGFSPLEYAVHRDLSDHPTTQARQLLPGQADRLSAYVLSDDLSHHLARLWEMLAPVLEEQAWTRVAAHHHRSTVSGALDVWREYERRGDRIIPLSWPTPIPRSARAATPVPRRRRWPRWGR